MEVQHTEVQSDRVLTLPNVLSALRLLGVPLFLWLILVPQADGWAVALLVVAGFTDWLDGYLARKWNQITRVGQLLDPVADRLYILATLIGLLLRGIVPAWLVVLLISRDLILAVVLAVLKRRGVTGLPVHFLGKAATFCLLYAFPLLLLGDGAGWLADTAKVFGWAFAVWGTALYWWAAVLYVGQARRIMAASS
ncbi:MAG TPA: CDP-diacylglycerol--glycerol-3-phosphate 3-phosphatidyltransferase [Candidatus Nanopelagicales bacterium]|nr:CDP-diacylglycerol--glycerol-3-phosphate 3-phosphatidyltransferase [Candidatus Nanopelagicales bacterium]